MPRYDYRCTSCGTVFENEHGMREHPQLFCPECGAAAERVFDASGIVLKGSGFYNTDQRGKKGATSATSHSDHETSGASKESPAESGATKAASDSGSKSSTASKSTEAKATAVAE